MAKAEFLQLSHQLEIGKHNIAGWFVSTKLDGERALWDGGISRGELASDVPYANTIKDARLIEPPVATGLWSRTGKVIHAPDWFLDKLPEYPLDGELYNGRGGFQELRKIVGKREPDDRWHLINYCVFDSPSWENLFEPRTIKVRNEYEYRITEAADRFRQARAKRQGIKPHWSFEFVCKFLSKPGRLPSICSVVGQQKLPTSPTKADQLANQLAEEEVDEGGEGIMLRNPIAHWVPERSWDLLKHKPWFDDEAEIIGFYAGNIGKHGTLQGKIGAIRVDWQGTEFKIGSGMNHDIRDFKERYMKLWASENPGALCPDEFDGKDLKVGDTITFKYRECSDDGVPKEARYWRKRD